MKLLIIHLSDIHFDGKDSYSHKNMHAITRALETFKGFSEVLIIVSGDIAFSGKDYQYETAWKFFRNLRENIRNQLKINSIEFAIVPGNHDVDYSKGNKTHKDLEKMFEKNEQDLEVANELKKMNCFYNHANGLKCFNNKQELIYNKIIDYEECSIQLNLINTGVFSSLEEDQGLHYMPKSETEKIDRGSDFVFSVMHHPHHWFNSCIKKELETALYEKSDIIFVGHEHYSSAMNIELENSKVAIFAGGELSNKGNWENSEFYAGIFDSERREYEVTNFKWDKKNNLYRSIKKEKRKLNIKRINKYGLIPCSAYMEQIFIDNKYMISSDISAYYVFPRIEEEITNEKRVSFEASDINKFNEEILKKKRIIITGRNDSGKTVLLKQLFKHNVESKCVIFLDAFNINLPYERSIRTAFEEIYTKESVKYDVFNQIPKDDKILIIDDLDQTDEKIFHEIIQKAEEEFGIIIYTCGKIVEFDIKERVKKGALEENYSKYRIQPFYKDKRKELVTNIVKILVTKESSAQETIIEKLCDALAKQKNLFHMDPDFITQFTKYYCNNIGETIQNDGGIFSKVFESNIVSLLIPYAKYITVDKILIILDKIAFQMHVTKQYPMHQREIISVLDKYNEEFYSEIDYFDFIDILLSAKIFEKVNSKYRFCEKTYLAYFVAREIKRRCMEESDFVEFEKALEFSCYDINADIILFVTYITDNINIIRMLMNKAENYTEKWEEFRVDPITIPYLSDVNQLEVKIVNDNDRENAERDEIEVEKQLQKEKEVLKDCIYDYDEEELTLLKKMLRSISLLVILSRTLPSFEHMMKREDKEKCVALIYKMPLKIFNAWALEVEINKIALIKELKAFHEWDYRREQQQLDDENVLNFLRWESISLLMEMMNASIGYATKENTHKFIDGFNREQSIMYEIEYLMGLDKRDSVIEFINEAENLFEKQKQQLPKIMIQRVARHFMVTSRKIQRLHIQKLNSKLWDGKLDNSTILIQKERNKKREQ